MIDKEMDCFILEHLAGNPFLIATKITTLLETQFKDLEISEISIRRFLTQKGYKWKGPLQRVRKMKLSKNQQDYNFENTIKIGIETMHSSLMNPVFI